MTRLWLIIVYLILYAPIAVLVVFSFNRGRIGAVWRGFTWDWYTAALNNQTIIQSLRLSLLVAVLTAVLATLVGTAAALAFYRRRLRLRRAYEAMFYLPIIVPEIVVGFAMVAFFGLIGFRLGLWTVVIAHVAFSVSYVFFVVRARLTMLPPRLAEAAMDLGANEVQAFVRVTLPLLAPAIAAAALLVFTISLDDYVITSFVAGAGAATLPLQVYSMIKTGITPEINAISTILLLTTVVLAAVSFQLRAGRFTKVNGTLVATVLIGIGAFAAGGSNPTVTQAELNLLIWSNYIAPSVVRNFEQRYRVKVNMETYDSNEAMLAKLQAGVARYDIIVPSDYMVRILIKQNLLLPLDHASLLNRVHLDPAMLNRPFDPQNRYSLPYAWTTAGIGYRKDKVTEPIDSWSALWNPAYRDRIVMLDDVREAFAVALKLSGYSLNSTNANELRQARDRLVEQKPLVRAYDSAAFDQVLLSGDAWLSHGYSGQIAKIMLEHPAIAFVIPREGCTIAIDNLCIPRVAQRPDLAHEFINYLMEPAVAAENMNFIVYPIPNRAALPMVRAELRNNPALFPPAEALKNCEYLADVGETMLLYDRYWTEVKIHR
ncbi:MAG: extracellular solute-binding protein [Acidobacteriota bacterium]|nr:extracellular solute-binding protein [Blastocatellia bacterium]MDW8241140.1 extracellular solute-binding protein [Acidobacteriota bacterium]